MAFSDRREIAVHEAAHAVVGRAVGGNVIAVDIGNGPEKKRKCYINWPFNVDTLKNIDWLDNDVADSARLAVRNIVTCFVAGEVAEKEIMTITTLSERITSNRFAAEGDEPLSATDLDMAVWLLNMAGIGDIDEVRAAEQRARDVIGAKKIQLRSLTDILLEDGYVEGERLNGTLEE